MNTLHRCTLAALLCLAPALAHADAPSDTLKRVVPIAPIEVSTSRANARSPLAQSTLDRTQLRGLNTGLDTPMTLSLLPGAYAYSDAGNGIGYSYLSVRGFPQRRIAVLVNGVPLNDPESHEVYWIDHPDLLASTSSVQLQRGVGPALYGSAALGGSVDLRTAPIDDAPHTNATVQAGSFGTRRLMLEASSGRLASGWGVYGRYSRIESDGYRDQSWSKLWSYALSAQKIGATQSIKVNLYGGPENTHLSYLGLAPEYFKGEVTGNADRDRRANPLTFAGEQDHFFEPHYELVHDWAPRRGVAVTQTLFWFDGDGFYDEGRTGQSLADYRLSPWATSDTTLYPRDHYAQDENGMLVRDSLGRALVTSADIVRRREITNRHYGWLPRARFEHARGALTLGGELRGHDGHHVGTLLSGDGLPPGTAPQVRYYDFHPRTLTGSLYAREEYDATAAVRVTADLAWRHQEYHFEKDTFDGVRFDQTYDFAQPRLGVSWTASPDVSTYASYAYASREPALRDLYDPEYVGDPLLLRSGTPLIRPEHVHDFELGGEWHHGAHVIGADLFRMDFRDELVDAGQFNTDLGYPILGNAARSIHQGLELHARTARAFGRTIAALDGNATLSDNHFVRFVNHYGPTSADDVVLDGKTLGFFPAQLANLRLAVDHAALHADATFRYVGRIYLDDTESRFLSTGPSRTLDATLAYAHTFGDVRTELSVRVLNATNTRYATGGYVDYDSHGDLVPTANPAATRGWLLGISVGR